MQDNVYMLPSRERTEHGRTTTHNLPMPLTPLVGREREVAAACALLQNPEVRLLTIVGTGGIGKTHLGLHIASELLNTFSDGVCLVLLASISDPDLVVSTLAQSLVVKEVGAEPLLDLLINYLQDKDLLLVLDNFEQVVAAAPVLTELLEACTSLKLLVTSRELLRVRGEQAFPLSPLAFPELTHLPSRDLLAEYGAVALFLQRARAVKPDFHVTDANASSIAAICARLDGLPLALELAAARLKHLTVQGLLARLEHSLQVLTQGPRDVHTRQQTLRNTIQWSYDLLSDQEQRLFRRLSVFVGGCRLEAVEALYTTLDGGSMHMFDGVSSLIDKSLLQQSEHEENGGEEPRFVMLETIREYGLEMLAASKEVETTRQAQALYYLRFAEEVEPKLFGAEQQRWYARMEQEHANLRTAMHWLQERKEVDLTLRLSCALWWFWLTHNHLNEGCQWLDRVLSESEEGDLSLRAGVLNGLGLLLSNQGDFVQAKRRCEESVALFQELEETGAMAWPLHHLACIANDEGEYTRAAVLFEECQAHFSEAEDKLGLAYVLCHLTLTYSELGDYEKACSCAQESLTQFREFEDNGGILEALCALADLLIVSQGEKAAVQPLLEEIRKRARGADDGWMMSALVLAGRVALSRGDLVTARSFIEESLTFYRAKGMRVPLVEVLILFGRLTAAQKDYAASQALYAESLTLARKMGMKRLISAGLEGLAGAVAVQGESLWAAHLWGAAEALRDAMHTLIPPVYRAEYERSVAAARLQLGEKDFAAAWAEGRSMTVDQVLITRESVTIPATHLSSQPPVKSKSTYPEGLTAREVEVLRLVAQGLTDAHIAEQLIISPRTVNTHLTSIYLKIQVSTRSGATRYAMEQHLV